jgi:sulfur carrier protein
MSVTCEVVGGETHEIALENPTAADLLRAVGFNPHEATVLADGRPVPDDAAIDTDRVQVLRLVTGG